VEDAVRRRLAALEEGRDFVHADVRLVEEVGLVGD